MGIVHCCFSREKDREKRMRTEMVLNYLNHSDPTEKRMTTKYEFNDLALSEAGFESAESLDGIRSEASV